MKKIHKSWIKKSETICRSNIGLSSEDFLQSAYLKGAEDFRSATLHRLSDMPDDIGQEYIKKCIEELTAVVPK